jgi:AP2-associated kinase
MLREHGTQRPNVFEILDVVHRMRGTKSSFRYVSNHRNTCATFPLLIPTVQARPPPPSQLIGTPSAMSSSLPMVQAKPYVPVGALEARKHVLDAIQPMRRGRPSQGVTLIPSPAPLSPVKSGPSRVAEALPRPRTGIAKFEDFPKSSDSDAGVRGALKPPGTQPSFYGFGDSFLHSPLSLSQDARPPPLPSRSRPTAPARQHHRTGPVPKRDAFDGLGSTSLKPPAPTLGTLAMSNSNAIGTGAGLRSPSAPFLMPDPETSVGNSVAQHGSSYTRTRVQSSSPSAELSAEERFPSIETMDEQFDNERYPSSSSANYASPVNNGASSLHRPISGAYVDPPRGASSIPRSRPPISGTTSQASRVFTPSQRAPSPSGPRPQSPQSTNFGDTGTSASKTAMSSRSEVKSPLKFPTAIPQPSQKSLSRRPSIALQGLQSTHLNSEKAPSTLSTDSGPDDSIARTGFRRKPATPLKTQTPDWLTGSEPASPISQSPDRRSSRPMSPTKHEAMSIASLVPPPQTRIPRKSVPAALVGTEPRSSNGLSLRVPERGDSTFSAESSGDDGPEDAVGTSVKEQPKSSPLSRARALQKANPKSDGKQDSPKITASSVYDLVDVGGDSSSSGSSVEKMNTGLRRSAAKRMSVHNLIDVSSFAPGRQTSSRHARRQTSVQDLIDITPGPAIIPNPGGHMITSPRPNNDTVDYDTEVARSRYPTIPPSLSSLSPSSPAPSPAPRLAVSSRPRPHSLFLPPSNDFLSPPTDDLAPSSSSDDGFSPPLRPRSQRRSSISDMVSKYEALSSSGAQTSRPLSRAPSGTYTKLIDPKSTGNATTTTSSSSSKPPTIQPPSNIRPFRSQGTGTPRPQSQETTPRALGHMRTGSKVFDMVSELSIANANPPSSSLARSPTPQHMPDPRAQGHVKLSSEFPGMPSGPEPSNANPSAGIPVRSSSPQHHLREPIPTRLNVVPPADFTGNPEVPVSPVRRGKTPPPHSPAPERPYQGVSKLIDQWQKKTEASEDALRGKPSRPNKAGLRH